MPAKPQPPALREPVYRGETYADVKRACHAWLLRHDPSYRRSCEAYAQPAADRAASRRPGKSA